ncbi:MAG: DUF2071 domain-containing protein [Actinomycetota bacterium]|nr:DUF2071 domain-containing protein [Actinomycetota bacterium]
MSPSGLDRFTTAQVDVENFALITHAVPVERLRRVVPDRFTLETFESECGREIGFISASSFCNHQIHWSAARYPAHDFDQSTFRTYVTHRGRRGAYFFGTYVSTRASFIAQIAVAANTHLAEFDVDIDLQEDGYASYSSRAVTAQGELHFELEARGAPEAKPPFATGLEHSEFITYRLHGFSRPPLGGVSYGPIEHRHMDPWSGQLISGRFDMWEELGLLPRDEWDTPFSVLVEPSVRFTLHPPRPAGA